MNLSNYLDIAQEVKAALQAGKPVVALESAALTDGKSYPENLRFANDLEHIIRAKKAVPATMAIIDGRMKVGLSAGELELICRTPDIQKVSRRDLPIVMAEGGTGVTTSASSMILASIVGIRVFAADGIGGVHRGATATMDISADLQELARTPVVVVCAGAKMILDIGLTLEYLETMGVPVLGYKTRDFPAFCCRKSGFHVDHVADFASDVARIARTKWDLGLQGGLLLGNPIPKANAISFEEMSAVTDKALTLAAERGITGNKKTPFLIAEVSRLTGGRSVESAKFLSYHNAEVAADVAIALSRL